MDSFETRAKYLEDLGVEYYCEEEYRGEVPRQPFKLNLFRNVRLPFSPEQWMTLVQRDGNNYIGGCCGTTGGIQDELNEVFRDNGFISIRDLVDLGDTMANHNGEPSDGFGFHSYTKTLADWVAQAKNIEPHERDCWAMIALLYHVTKDHYKPERPMVFRETVGEFEKATSILRTSFWRIALDHAFGEAKNSQDKTNRLMKLHLVSPALKTFMETLKESAPAPFDGFAIVKNDEVVTNSLGYYIFDTKDKAEEILTLHRNARAEYKEKDLELIDEVYGIRPVRVSLEDGIVFK